MQSSQERNSKVQNTIKLFISQRKTTHRVLMFNKQKLKTLLGTQAGMELALYLTGKLTGRQAKQL